MTEKDGEKALYCDCGEKMEYAPSIGWYCPIENCPKAKEDYEDYKKTHPSKDEEIKELRTRNAELERLKDAMKQSANQCEKLYQDECKVTAELRTRVAEQEKLIEWHKTDTHDAMEWKNELQNRLSQAEAELEEWRTDQKHCMDERCAGEWHCTCVPPLRRHAKRLESKLSTLEKELKEAEQKYLRAGMELCARFAVRRMTAWTVEDDKKSQSFREGIEQACSDLAIKFRDGSLTEPWIKELDRAVPYERLQEMYNAESRKNVQLQQSLSTLEAEARNLAGGITDKDDKILSLLKASEGMEKALDAASHELGVPQPDYPAPVYNACTTINKALADFRAVKEGL